MNLKNLKITQFIDLSLSALLGFALLSTGCSKTNILPLQYEVMEPPPPSVTIKINNYCPDRFVDFFAKPMSFRVSQGKLRQDFNRDGLSDEEALKLGLSPFHEATSGITDFLGVQYLGMNKDSLSRIPQGQNITQSTSGDWLTDYQKTFLNLLPLNAYDSIGRGFPDSLAALARLPLFDRTIPSKDLAGDGISTITKIKNNLPPTEFASAQMLSLAVKYQFTTHINPTNPRSPCYDFTTTSPRSMVDNGDLYLFYFIGSNADRTTPLVIKSVVVNPTVPDKAILEYNYGEI